MTAFLAQIARLYATKHATELSGLTFVFPNKRAGVFFRHYLSEQLDAPAFAPEVMSISECFASFSSKLPADRLGNLFRLYDIYRSLAGRNEDFDGFVFWGEMMLSDFDEIDKHLIDAKQLFSNVADLKQIDELFDTLSEEQKEAIKEFWSHFIPCVEAGPKKDYITVWKILYSVYEEFRRQLTAENLATEGMIYRELAERIASGDRIFEKEDRFFVFVGFNALNLCEKKLFHALRKENKADFYFDYQARELRESDNPASRFYAENTRLFPSRYPLLCEDEDTEKSIELIAVPSETGQAKEIYNILNALFPEGADAAKTINTALVLPDENLLIPLLHSIPPQVEAVNVTMGFPLKSTPASALIEYILDLQRRARVSGSRVSYYYKNVLDVLHHRYIASCSSQIAGIERNIVQDNRVYVDADELLADELLASVFRPVTDSDDLLGYLLDIVRHLQLAWRDGSDRHEEQLPVSDVLYQYYVTLSRMADVVRNRPEDIHVAVETMSRWIRQIFSGLVLPFEGEPLAGLQIMGMLETRCLDFENLIIPSFNEGIFPRRNLNNSFIPYMLRRSFALPVSDFHDAVSAYHFYRLLHRAKRVFFLYDSRSEGIKTGEVSRFLHQLHYHYGVKITRKTRSFDLRPEEQTGLQIPKNPDVMSKLMRFTLLEEKAPAFSASSLNTYLDCPLKFYLTQMEKLEEPDEVQEHIEGSMFGTLFHATMEKLYKPYVGKRVEVSDIQAVLEDPLKIDVTINQAFAEKFFMRKDAALLPLEGSHLLIARVIRKYVRQMLVQDKAHAPFRYLASEFPCSHRFPIFQGRLQVNLKGFIDRIDQKEGLVRILDYKTGLGKQEFKSISDMFDHSHKNRPKYEFQIFLYAWIYKQMKGVSDVLPAISFLRNIFKADYSTRLFCKADEYKGLVDGFTVFEDDFVLALTSCLEEIFNPDIPFSQTENLKTCTYCPYVSICNR